MVQIIRLIRNHIAQRLTSQNDISACHWSALQWMNIASILNSRNSQILQISWPEFILYASTESQIIGKLNEDRSDLGAWFQAVASAVNLIMHAKVLLSSNCDYRYPSWSSVQGTSSPINAIIRLSFSRRSVYSVLALSMPAIAKRLHPDVVLRLACLNDPTSYTGRLLLIPTSVHA